MNILSNISKVEYSNALIFIILGCYDEEKILSSLYAVRAFAALSVISVICAWFFSFIAVKNPIAFGSFVGIVSGKLFKFLFFLILNTLEPFPYNFKENYFKILALLII